MATKMDADLVRTEGENKMSINTLNTHNLERNGNHDEHLEEDEFSIRPLTPLSFDTVLTAGDLKRLIQIVSVM